MTSTETGFSSARFAITFFPAERGNSSPGGKGSIATKGIVALLAVLLLLGLGVAAQAPESGWVSLFNEKDLTGWKKNGEEKWVVERGTILCESAANSMATLRPKRTIAISICALSSRARPPATAVCSSTRALPASTRDTARTS